MGAWPSSQTGDNRPVEENTTLQTNQNTRNVAYVVLFGDVGSGKSTLVEKLTGIQGRSSDASESFTRSTEVFAVPNGSLIIADTPGANSMAEKFQQNLHIAHALNFYPISSVLIVVKAEERIDNVIDHITKYAEGFLPEDFPLDIAGVCVTHMDTVKWNEDQMRRKLEIYLGIKSAIFSNKITTTQSTLQRDFLVECNRTNRVRNPLKIDVDSETFLRLFKINNTNLKILREARAEVARFDGMKQDFYKERVSYCREEQIDMIYEFQEYMRNEIIEAQKRLSEKNSFELLPGPEMASEAGHLANMTNQLRLVLRDIRIEAMKYSQDMDTIFKACNKCGQIWQKVEGCEGETTCGARPNRACDDRRGEHGMMATFRFFWDGTKLNINLLGKKEKQRRAAKNLASGWGAGCGAYINWQSMRPVNASVDTLDDPSSTQDIAPLQNAGKNNNWKRTYDEAIGKMKPLEIKIKKRKTDYGAIA